MSAVVDSHGHAHDDHGHHGGYGGVMRFALLPAGEFPGNLADHIYLVDPIGNLMLRFPSDPDSSRMIKDLQRLLRYSRVG